jgi:hypothetical protein
MAENYSSGSDRVELRHQVFRSLLDALKQLPSYKHAALVSSVLSELIDNDRQPLELLVDAIDSARLKVGEQ